ncbi:MAG TPA: hypothetical protein VF798_07015 [Burkholderiaceae bacterium]
MKTVQTATQTSRGGNRIWLALVAGMACSNVLMLTSHSHAALQTAPAAQSEQTVVVTARRMSAGEKAQVRAELRQQGGLRA